MNVVIIINIIMIVIVFVTLCVMQAMRFRWVKGTPGFDERQRMVRGRAYRSAFYTVLVLTGICAAIDAAGVISAIPQWFQMISVILIGLGVYWEICTLSDAGLRPKDDRFMSFGGWGGLLLVNLNNIRWLVLDKVTDTSELVFIKLISYELMTIILMLVITGFVRTYRLKKDEMDERDES